MGDLARRRHLRHAVGALLAAAFLLSAAAPGARAQEETGQGRARLQLRPGRGERPGSLGEIRPSWANCSRGRMQSPIDLSHDRVRLERSLGFLNYSYRPAQATIVNRGHDIMVRFSGDAGRLVINGTDELWVAVPRTFWREPWPAAIVLACARAVQ
ncbi:alpha carbonic anhydrase 7-like [Panicum miliaceum]|uniref:Alpha carbonic anhydrase 7-like n=1 Tax=Panicum miliaceum TaxID=4540 RepID=A0A3L6RHP7_PANMI|nr:alpha carbonic anhydrase 7-like [Panicum miliaceum]